MGTFDAQGNYTPRQVVERDLSQPFADAISGTMVELKEGKLVTGTVVRITHDEVLVEIGYKTEGVILSRELSIRNDVDPNEIVKLGEYSRSRTKKVVCCCQRSVRNTSALGAM